MDEQESKDILEDKPEHDIPIAQTVQVESYNDLCWYKYWNT